MISVVVHDDSVMWLPWSSQPQPADNFSLCPSKGTAHQAQMISYGLAVAAAALLFGGVLQAESRKLTQDQPFVTPIACDVLIIGGGPVRK